MSITAVQPSAQNIISIPTEILGKRDIVGNPAWLRVHTSGLFTAYLPLHGYFPFARLSGAHVVKVSGVVVGVRATEH